MGDAQQELWAPREIPPAGELAWELTTLSVFVRTDAAGELLLASRLKPTGREAPEAGAEAPGGQADDLEWRRWALKAAPRKIQLAPLFPDLAVVVKPETSFVLHVDAQTKVYLRCPLWVRVEALNGKATTITELPTAELSKTWFGTFTEGELCYWISSGMRTGIEADAGRPYLAICPLKIANKSREPLKVEKLCLRVGGLSLFLKDRQLWSDEVTIDYRGSESISQIRAAGRAPAEARDGVMLSGPREAAKASFVAKTFIPLRSLSGFGLSLAGER
ncbi:DUF432 domain-containing protein [Candidatus Sumerlaeota bacterium]